MTKSGCSVAYKRKVFPWWSAEPLTDLPLLGTMMGDDNTTANIIAFEVQWTTQDVRFLANHRVGRTALAPGTLYLEMARQAACGTLLIGGGGEVALSDIQFTEMLFLDEDGKPH